MCSVLVFCYEMRPSFLFCAFLNTDFRVEQKGIIFEIQIAWFLLVKTPICFCIHISSPSKLKMTAVLTISTCIGFL